MAENFRLALVIQWHAPVAGVFEDQFAITGKVCGGHLDVWVNDANIV